MRHHDFAIVAFTALTEDDTDKARLMIGQVDTDDLLAVERLCHRLTWICRDERHARNAKEPRI